MQPSSAATTTVRLLQTTDLHMQLLAFDYLQDRPTRGRSLQGLEAAIRDARADGLPTLLLDGGDFLQGSALADALAEEPVDAHPMIAAFNRLDYDVLALGNHEFEYGLPFLTDAIAQARATVVSANLRLTDSNRFVAPWTVVQRDVTLSDGRTVPLGIGVIGFAPPQITDWSAAQLKGQLRSEDALSAALTQLPRLRRAGAHIVVALCHGGPAHAGTGDALENPAGTLARLRGVDAILMGHLHETFPGPAFDGIDGIDAQTATLHGTPAMMPGSHGASLGQMDLDLSVDATGNWSVTGHRVSLIPARITAPATAARECACETTENRVLSQAHARARALLAAPVCDSPVRATTYFSVIGHDPIADVVARAQVGAVRDWLSRSDYRDLPLLSATAPFRAGGHGGVDNFVDIGPGPVRRRDCHAIAPFDNPLCAVLRRGWQIRQWLERSANFFARAVQGQGAGWLASGVAAPFQFDTIHGLSYSIDLTQDATREALDGPGRVHDILLDGNPLEDDATVVVVTSSYRAHGGGGLVQASPGDIIHETPAGLRAILTDALSSGKTVPRAVTPPWGFRPVRGSEALFRSNPAAAGICPPGVRLVEEREDGTGFAIFALDLDP